MASARPSLNPASSKKLDTLNAKLTSAAQKVVTYLESKLQANGSFGNEAKDLACYFKSPMMFIIANKTGIAHRILKYIQIAFMTSEGDFKTHATLKSVNGAYSEYWSYANGWIVRAANQLKMVEVAQPGGQYLSRYFLGDRAGFATNQIDKIPKMTDVLTVAHHGLINLEMDNMELALTAGNHLCRVIDKQPDLKKGFYLRLDEKENVITKEQTPFYFVSASEPNQLHFMIGYPAAFLALIYKKTQRLEFLTAAKTYLNFSLSCDKSVYTCDFSHKISWAASLLYECTGDEKYLEVIDKIADHFIEKQHRCGMWFAGDINASYDQSAEIACWFLDIVKNVNSILFNSFCRPIR